MLPTRECGRVVIVASAERALPLASLFDRPALRDWSPTIASSPEHARFLIRLLACDAVLYDDSALERPGDDGIRWLSGRGRFPMLFLAEPESDTIQHALAEGAQLWLPRSASLRRPELLATALDRLRDRRTIQSRLRQARRQAQRYRTQVRRLADLMWTALPVEARPCWLSQRYMLERLHEEVLRSTRHGTPLTVVLGEWKLDPAHDLGDPLARPDAGLVAEQQIRDWTILRVLQSKRRSDVAGQYGLRGFMLLLPHTPDAGAVIFCQRLRNDLGESPPGLPTFWRLHTAMGTAGFSGELKSPRSLLRLAEERLEEDRDQRPTGPGPSSEPPARTS